MYACAILYVTVWFFSSSLFCRKCVCCFCFCEYNRSSHHTCRESETACECELVWVCVCVCMLKRRLCRVAKFIPFHSKRELSIFYFFFLHSALVLMLLLLLLLPMVPIVRILGQTICMLPANPRYFKEHSNFERTKDGKHCADERITVYDYALNDGL